MILTWHFTFFLLNVVIWIVAGVAISKFLIHKKTKIKKVSKFFLVGISGAIIGGLFGFLANGMPDVGFSISNLASAAAFTVFPVLAIIPKAKTS